MNISKVRQAYQVIPTRGCKEKRVGVKREECATTYSFHLDTCTPQSLSYRSSITKSPILFRRKGKQCPPVRLLHQRPIDSSRSAKQLLTPNAAKYTKSSRCWKLHPRLSPTCTYVILLDLFTAMSRPPTLTLSRDLELRLLGQSGIAIHIIVMYFCEKSSFILDSFWTKFGSLKSLLPGGSALDAGLIG